MAVSRIIQLVILVLLALLLMTTGAVADTPVGTKFTYQGRLAAVGQPANGNYDFLFQLYDLLSGGNKEGSDVPKSPVAVKNGLFTTELDFGTAVFKGDARWLSIKVRKTGTATFTTLSPRQPITATPYAISAAWSGLSGVPADILDGDADTTYSAGAGLVLNGTTFALNTTSLSDNSIVKYTGSGGGRLTNSLIKDDGTRVTIGGPTGLQGFRFGVRATSTNTFRSELDIAGSGSAIQASATGTGAGNIHIGVNAEAVGTSKNYAVKGDAQKSGAVTNIGGYFSAAGATTENYSVYASRGDVYVFDEVGIGDKTPDAKLDVESSSSSADGVLINNTGFGDPILGFQLSGFGKFTMGVDDSDGDKFKIGTSGININTRLTIESNGEVGIGTTFPSQKLHVSGNTYISGKLGIGKTPIAKLDVNGDLKVRDSITVTATSGSLGHVLAEPVAGHWLYGSTSTTATGFANLVAQMENTDTSYLGYVLNRN